MKSVVSFFYYISILAFIRNSGKSHCAHVTLGQAHKLENLKYRHRFGISVDQNNSNVVVNLSTYKLSDVEIMLLSRGLNFSAPPPNGLDQIDVMTSFECLLRHLPLGQKSALYRLKHTHFWI